MDEHRHRIVIDRNCFYKKKKLVNGRLTWFFQIIQRSLLSYFIVTRKLLRSELVITHDKRYLFLTLVNSLGQKRPDLYM